MAMRLYQTWLCSFSLWWFPVHLHWCYSPTKISRNLCALVQPPLAKTPFQCQLLTQSCDNETVAWYQTNLEVNMNQSSNSCWVRYPVSYKMRHILHAAWLYSLGASAQIHVLKVLKAWFKKATWKITFLVITRCSNLLRHSYLGIRLYKRF